MYLEREATIGTALAIFGFRETNATRHEMETRWRWERERETNGYPANRKFKFRETHVLARARARARACTWARPFPFGVSLRSPSAPYILPLFRPLLSRRGLRSTSSTASDIAATTWRSADFHRLVPGSPREPNLNFRTRRVLSRSPRKSRSDFQIALRIDRRLSLNKETREFVGRFTYRLALWRFFFFLFFLGRLTDWFDLPITSVVYN